MARTGIASVGFMYATARSALRPTTRLMRTPLQRVPLSRKVESYEWTHRYDEYRRGL